MTCSMRSHSGCFDVFYLSSWLLPRAAELGTACGSKEPMDWLWRTLNEFSALKLIFESCVGTADELKGEDGVAAYFPENGKRKEPAAAVLE